MIKSPSRHNLFMDFKNIQVAKGHPSDIDMFYLSDKYLVLAEIKNQLGTFTQSQKNLYQRIADNFNTDVYILFLTHDKFVEKGDKVVDVSKCSVREVYVKNKEDSTGRWFVDSQHRNCQEMLDAIEFRYF